jgi:L-lactate utilization protein LutB
MNKKTMRDVIMVGIGVYVGWYLAINEEKAVRKVLDKVEKESIKLKSQVAEKINENKQLQDKINQVKAAYSGVIPPR